jgi:predicted RNA-binding protein with PIN domain
MLLLIDGYNLLHVSGLFGPEEGPPTLERSRLALLEFLERRLAESVRKKATIVFDAASAPPGLPSTLQHAEMVIRFAPRKSSADDLIAELIAQEADPRHLTVVSSDHAVQRAARQRGASYVDSEIWFRELRQAAPASTPDEKPQSPVLGNPFPPGYAEEEAAELRDFGGFPPRGSSSKRRKS